jgi:uncharacterized membrane protein
VGTRAEALARIADARPVRVLEPLVVTVGDAVERGGVADALRAERLLGHPAHPVVNDVPIGLWTSASVLDVVGGRRSRSAASLLCSLGVVSAVPTALTGIADLARLEGEDRRLGIVHAAGNLLAVVLYAESARRRARGQHLRGAVAALAGGAAMTAAGMVGGELAFNRGAARVRD